MTDKVNKLLVDIWRRYEESKKKGEPDLNLIKTAISICNQTARTLDHRILAMDHYHLVNSMSYFSPLQGKVLDKKGHPVKLSKVIGILVMSDLSPSKVLEGKCGAGSEYAVDNLAEALAKRGYAVYVFSNIDVKLDAPYCVGGRNPQYLPIDRDKETDLIAPTNAGWVCSLDGLLLLHPGTYRLDHLIVWRTRSAEKYNFNNYAPKVHYWSHDIATGGLEFKEDYIYCLSDYHIENLSKKLGPRKYIKGCNGTSVDINKPIPDKKPKSVFYASNWARGLSDLLEIWPRVVKQVPDAHLYVFYGKQTFGLMSPQDQDDMESKVISMKKLNVHNEGMLPYNKLLQKMGSMSILCYPYNGAGETFSIICAAAQQLGCVTVVSKRDALVETVSAQDKDLLSSMEIEAELVRYLQMSEEELLPIREKHKQETKCYTWDSSAEAWETALSN